MRRSAMRWAALGAVLALGAAACSGQGAVPGGGAAAPDAPVATAAASPTPTGPEVTVTPASGASDIRMDSTVTVSVDRGALTKVTVRPAKGSVVAGRFDAAKGEWRSTAAMAAGTTYTVTATAAEDGAEPVTHTSTFTTLTPAAVNPVKLNVGDGQVVGVGMPIIVTFAKPVKNTDDVLDALTVTTTPQVEGSWHWMEPSKWVARNTQVWWRPKEYWPAGTKVRLVARLGGVELSPGVWGKRTYTSTFSTGDAVVNTVDLAKHTLTMRKNGAVVRVIKITAGKAGPKWSTRGGIKVITEKRAQLKMDSSTIGVSDEKDPDFYSEIEHWTMRLTWSGEFLHARPGSEAYFGRANVSHGCTGMSMADARWLFDHSRIGDVVEYQGGKRELEWGNGYTAWEMPYAKWSAGVSA